MFLSCLSVCSRGGSHVVAIEARTVGKVTMDLRFSDLITARQRGLGKVMRSQVSIILSSGGYLWSQAPSWSLVQGGKVSEGVQYPGGRVYPGSRVYPGGRVSRGG